MPNLSIEEYQSHIRKILISEQEIQELNGLLTRMQQNGEAYYQNLDHGE